jgi:two-component system, OmpR family, sensor histidine kinase SenX3
VKRGLSDRLLLFVCAVLVFLVGVLAVVQYRWSARVASADAQREREHLETSATLFATKFNGIAARAIEFVQNEAWNSHQTGAAVTNVPRIIGELYYVDLSGKDAHVERLSDKGLFAKTEPPAWMPQRCAPFPLSNPPAFVAPIYNVEFSSASASGSAAAGLKILEAFGHDSARCFVARMNESFLRDDLAPSLIRESFGDTSIRDYDFAIATGGSNPSFVYGTKLKPDVAKPFFSVVPMRLPGRRRRAEYGRSAKPDLHSAVRVQCGRSRARFSR